jgi:hypothetical protein
MADQGDGADRARVTPRFNGGDGTQRVSLPAVSPIFPSVLEIDVGDFSEFAAIKRFDADLDLQPQHLELERIFASALLQRAQGDAVLHPGKLSTDNNGSESCQYHRMSFTHSSSVRTATPSFFASASLEPAPGPATT